MSMGLFGQSIGLNVLEDDPRNFPKTVVLAGLSISSSLGTLSSTEYLGFGVMGMHQINDELDVLANLGISSLTTEVEAVGHYYFYDRQVRRNLRKLLASNAYVNTFLVSKQEQLFRLGGRGGIFYSDFNNADFHTGSLFLGGVFNGRRAGRYIPEGSSEMSFNLDYFIYADIMIPVVTSELANNAIGYRVGIDNRVANTIFGFDLYYGYKVELGRFADIPVADDQRHMRYRFLLALGAAF